jgi:hypothetical protein
MCSWLRTHWGKPRIGEALAWIGPDSSIRFGATGNTKGDPKGRPLIVTEPLHCHRAFSGHAAIFASASAMLPMKSMADSSLPNWSSWSTANSASHYHLTK